MGNGAKGTKGSEPAGPPWSAGNAAARLEPFVTKSGIYAYGSLPQIDELFQSQARETDRKRRETLLHQIQQIVADQVLAAPIFQQGFLCGVGPRVADHTVNSIPMYPFPSYEDMRLKPQ